MAGDINLLGKIINTETGATQADCGEAVLKETLLFHQIIYITFYFSSPCDMSACCH